MPRGVNPSEFLHYLSSSEPGEDPERVPPLNELSKELRISISALREQLEVAKALGLVEVRPRTGIRRLPYSFFPAVKQSLSAALALKPTYFLDFADLRNQIEAAYWDQAVRLLTSADHAELRSLVERAWMMLRGTPIHIPHREHRQLHLGIYKRLKNPFVWGILEAYWDAYEAVGLNVYADYDYLEQVWKYHEQMVDAICSGDFEQGYQVLVVHKDLLYQAPVPKSA